MSFKKGFDKVAYVDPIAMIGHSVESGKKTNKDKAEANAEFAAQAIKARKKHLAHYLLNPHVPGPMSELRARLGRRYHASAEEQPIVAGLGNGLVSTALGGKRGKNKIEAAEKTASFNPEEIEKIMHRAHNRHSSAQKKKLLAGAAIVGGALAAHKAITVATAGDKKSKESHKNMAETLGRYIKGQKNVREKNTAGYILNPHAHGPLQEAGARLARRHHASAAEHPYRTALIPLYGAIRGGKAGEKDVK